MHTLTNTNDVETLTATNNELRRTIAGLRGTVALLTEDRNREYAEKCALLHERALERQAADQ